MWFGEYVKLKIETGWLGGFQRICATVCAFCNGPRLPPEMLRLELNADMPIRLLFILAAGGGQGLLSTPSRIPLSSLLTLVMPTIESSSRVDM